jgi:hypothetical protein
LRIGLVDGVARLNRFHSVIGCMKIGYCIFRKAGPILSGIGRV